MGMWLLRVRVLCLAPPVNELKCYEARHGGRGEKKLAGGGLERGRVLK